MRREHELMRDALGPELYDRLMQDLRSNLEGDVDDLDFVLGALRRVGVTWARTFGVDVLGNPEHPKPPLATLVTEYSPLLGALDRCAHGRHARDNCFSCPGGQSAGNLFLEPGTRIGTGLYGDAIVAPDNLERSRIDPWCPIPGYHGFK